MSAFELKGLREKAFNIGKQINELAVQCGQRAKEDGELNGWRPEDREKFDALEADLKSVQDQIDYHEKAQRVALTANEKRQIPIGGAGAGEIVTLEDVDQAFRAWCLGGSGIEIPQDFQESAAKLGMNLRQSKLDMTPPRAIFSQATRARIEAAARETIVQRATGPLTITTTKGGHTIQTDLMTVLTEAMKAYGGMREAATVIATGGGNPLSFPTVDDTGNKATILAINTAAAGKDLTFGQVTLGAHKYTSGLILVPIELMQDTAVDLVGYIGRAIGIRVARGTNEHFTVGTTSTTNPVGCVTRATTVVSGSSTTELSYANLLTVLHSVDPAYQAAPGARWMMHDKILKDAKSLVDTQGRPLWLPSMAGGEPATLLGYPYTVNQDMVSSTTAVKAKILVFGDLRQHVIRDAGPFELLRLDERYAEKAQVCFVSFSRHDSNTLVASTDTTLRPVKAMRSSSD